MGDDHAGHDHNFGSREEWAVHIIGSKYKIYSQKKLRKLRLKKHTFLANDVKVAREQEDDRSIISRAEDPILPEDPIEELSKV